MKVRWKCGSFVSSVCSVGCRVHQTISQNECIYHYHLRARNLFSLFTAIIIHYYHNWGYHSLAWPGTQRCLDLSCHCLYCGPYEGVCDVTCNVEFNPLGRCCVVMHLVLLRIIKTAISLEALNQFTEYKLKWDTLTLVNSSSGGVNEPAKNMLIIYWHHIGQRALKFKNKFCREHFSIHSPVWINVSHPSKQLQQSSNNK